MTNCYIISGGTGFVGNNLVRELERQGVNNIVVQARSEKKVEESLQGTNAKVVYGTIMNADDLDKLFSEAQSPIIFVHTASVVYLGGDKKRLEHMYDTNIEGTRNVIEACLKYGARLVYVSSVHSIPKAKKGKIVKEVCSFDPKKVKGHYAKTKAIASQMVLDAVRNDGLDAILVHPSGISGPNDFTGTYLGQMVEDYRAGRIPVAVKGGYDFVDVRDVVAGIISVSKNAERGSCYLLTNKFYSVRQVLDILHELGVGKRVKRTLPIWVAWFGLPFYSMYAKAGKKRPLYTKYSLRTLGENSNFSYEKANNELGYSPRELKDSLRDMI